MSSTILDNLKIIFSKSVNAVKPQDLIHKNVQIQDNGLFIGKDNYSLQKQCYLVGFGKAVINMAYEMEKILGSALKTGIVTVPLGICEIFPNPLSSSRINYIEGAPNNLPDENAERGAEMIKDLIEKLEADDLLLVLISGGGSALLPLPKHPLTLTEKLNLTANLGKRGASIWELNSVRKRLSILKGGGLAKIAYPATVVSLIISDIVDDPIDFIASGPTAQNLDDKNVAIDVLKKYSLYDELASYIHDILNEDDSGSQTFSRVHNYILGNNEIATNAALEQAEAFGYQSFVLSTRVKGNINRICEIYIRFAYLLSQVVISDNSEDLKKFVLYLQSVKEELGMLERYVNKIINFNFTPHRGVCLILSGEPTVRVTGNGKGGRNQELALMFSIEISKLNVNSANISFLSGGTDGIDGPTDAAGALGTCSLVGIANAQNMDPTPFLADNNSYTFYTGFNNGEYLIRTGHTGTNVMDIHILIVSAKAE